MRLLNLCPTKAINSVEFYHVCYQGAPNLQPVLTGRTVQIPSLKIQLLDIRQALLVELFKVARFARRAVRGSRRIRSFELGQLAQHHQIETPQLPSNALQLAAPLC